MKQTSSLTTLAALCCCAFLALSCGNDSPSGGRDAVEAPSPSQVSAANQNKTQASSMTRRKTSEWLRKGDAFAAAGKYGEAVVAYKEALLLSPNNAAAQHGSRLKIIAPEAVKRAKTLLDNARASGRLQRLRNAHALLLKAQQLDPNNVEISQDIAYALVHLRRFSEARTKCEILMGQHPEQSRAYLYAAEAAYLQGDFKGCITYLRQAEPIMEQAENDPTLSPHRIWHMHSLAAQKAHLIPEAIEKMRRCVDAVPNNWEYQYSLGGIYLDDGQFVLALQGYTKALKIQPNHAMTHYYIARAYHKKGEIDTAIKAYERSIELNHSQWMADVFLARAYESKGDRKSLLRAASYLDSALSKNEVSHEALFTLSGVWRKLNDPEQAERWLDQFNRVDGIAKAQEEKLRAFRQRLRADPTDIDAHLSCIEVFVEFSHLHDAFEEAQKLLIKDPKHPEGLWHIGNLLQTQKKYKEAGFEAEKLIAVRPDDARGFTLAAFCALQLNDITNAERHARRAFELAPQDFGAMDVLVSTLQRIDPEHPQLPLLLPTYRKMQAAMNERIRANKKELDQRTKKLLRGK